MNPRTKRALWIWLAPVALAFINADSGIRWRKRVKVDEFNGYPQMLACALPVVEKSVIIIQDINGGSLRTRLLIFSPDGRLKHGDGVIIRMVIRANPHGRRRYGFCGIARSAAVITPSQTGREQGRVPRVCQSPAG